ncbi:protein phosphatase 2C domain-containing protein [Pedobacter metabolipauper]|uniref:Serine/threonine protein phosphatase PrpC n=1 Tax=Pedobacter metabolipauper TaxID=425513 RepID=A0A4V6PVZ6_9SPHI|nr:protein phosphatase 2C domain-containing protein [Pedobacter metabolipauper]TDQ07359.1 serine/threonine protein phosphatase PrpC [Pedobacter metabolipauper]
MSKNYFGITDTGKVRSNNEDTFIAQKTTGSPLIVACVIDGVGGYSGGEIAAEIARHSILLNLSDPDPDLSGLMKKAIIDANEKIMTEKQQTKEYEGMACVLTLALVDLQKNLLHYAHVGDTRLYLLRDNSLVKLSKDQSFVGFMEDTGRLTEDQAMRHPKRNEINKALGFGADLVAQDDYIEIGQSPFLPGDVILLCSDGLSDMVNKKEITEILISESDLPEKGKLLIDAANKNGGADNITVVLVKNDNRSALHEITRPEPVISVVIPESTPETVLEDKSGQPDEHDKPNKPEPEFKTSVQERLMPARKPNIAVPILSILCLIFIATSVYLFWFNTNGTSANLKPQHISPAKDRRNTQEIKLQDTLNKLSGNTLILTDSLFKSPILLSESLLFNKDTLYIKAEKNMVIRADSSFKGTAIVVKPIARHVQLRNLTFENFKTAISLDNNALVLKDVKFNNCFNAVQSNYILSPNVFINGKISRINFTTDSIKPAAID